MKSTSFLALLALLTTLSCSKGTPQPFQVIPMPNEVTVGKGVFPVKGAALAVDPALDAPSQAAVSAFAQALETATALTDDSIVRTLRHDTPRRFGVDFEGALPDFIRRVGNLFPD